MYQVGNIQNVVAPNVANLSGITRFSVSLMDQESVQIRKTEEFRQDCGVEINSGLQQNDSGIIRFEQN
jgi:hypothetical protein